MEFGKNLFLEVRPKNGIEIGKNQSLYGWVRNLGWRKMPRRKGPMVGIIW